MSVFVPTFLQMCNCKTHGRFVSPEGVKSLEFASKEDGLEVLRHLRATRAIDEHEEKFLASDVRAQSGLGETKEDENLWGRLVCDLANESFNDDKKPPFETPYVH